ncbi:hypothetical protein HOF92_09185 [bacterium]|jgi:hypothetical protein|nr:hypothetical protein [bacterium]
MQRMLGDMDLYHGPADGRWNNRLKDAVKSLRIPIPRGLKMNEAPIFMRRLQKAHGSYKRTLRTQEYLFQLRVYHGPRNGKWNSEFKTIMQDLKNEKAYLSKAPEISLRFMKLLRMELALQYGGLISASRSYFFRILRVSNKAELMLYCFRKSQFLEDALIPRFPRFHNVEMDPHHADFVALMKSFGYRPFLEIESGGSERGFRPISDEQASLQLILLAAYRQSFFIRPPYNPNLPPVNFEIRD